MAEDIYKVSVRINGKNQDIELNEFNKKGHNGYAKEYPDAVIRMRNKDNEDFAIPLVKYDEAYNSGLRPYVTRQKVSEPKPVKQVKTSKNENKPVTYKPGEVALQVEKESGLLPVDGDQKNKSEKENPYTSAKPVGGFEETRLYSYINHDNYGKDKVKDFKRETDDLMKVDVSRGYPQAVDLADETMRRTMPVFSNIVSRSIDKVRENAFSESFKDENTLLFRLGEEYRRAAKYNRMVTPDAILQDVKDTISKDENFGKMIREESARLEIDPEVYATRYALPTIQKILYNQLINEKVPKSSAEYIFGNAFSSSILGMLVDTALKPLEQRQLEYEARGKYNASTAEDVASTVASIAMDLPVMGVTGGLGNAASKTLLRGQVNRMMSAGLTREAAEGIATRAAQQTGMKWGLRSVSEGVNFGAYEGLGNVLSQLHTKDEIDASEAGTAMAKGMITGAAMGIFGVGNESIGRALSTKIGDKASQAATYATSLGGRTAILAGSSVLGQWAGDPNFNADNINWTDEFIHAGLTNLGFDIIGAAKRIGKSSVKSRDINLTKDDIRQLNESGINGSNVKEIAESLIDVLRKAKEFGNQKVNSIGIEQKASGTTSLKDFLSVGKNNEIVKYGSQNEISLFDKPANDYNINSEGIAFGDIMTNEGISLSTKSKISYLMTGQLYKLSPSTGLSIIRDQSTGDYIIDTYNMSGQLNERRTFKNEKEAAAYKSYAESEVKRNQAEALEDILNASSKTRASIDVFNSFVDEGISKDRLLDVYSRGKNGETLSKEDKSLFDRINTEIDNTIANDFGYGVLKAKNIIMQAHGLSESEFNKIRRKSYNRMSDVEKQIYDDYLDAMRDVANPSGRQTSAADMSSQSEQAKYYLGNSSVEDTNTETVNVPDGPSPSLVKPSTQNVNVPDGPIARGKQKALEDYDGGNFNAQNVREYSTHIEMAGQRLARYFNKEQVNDIMSMEEPQLYDFISKLDVERRQAVEDFIEATTKQNELDRLAQEHIDGIVERDNRLAQSMTGEIPGKVILATYDGKDYVVLNGYKNKTGEYMAVPIERGQDGYIDFTSFNPDNVSTVKMPGARFREFSHDDIYTPEQTEAMERYNNASEGQYNVGDKIRMSVDGENILNADVLDVDTTEKGAIRGYVIQVEGENKPVTVKSEEISELTQNAIKADYTKRYAAIDEQLSKIKDQQEKENKGEITIDESTPVQDEQPSTEALNNESRENTVQEVNELPLDESGEPVFHSVAPEKTIRFLQEESGFTPLQTKEFINLNISDLSKALSKLEKKKPKVISRYSEYKRNLTEWESEYNDTKKKLDYWTDIKEKMEAQNPASTQPQETNIEDEFKNNIYGQRTITQGGDNQNTGDVAQTVPVQGNESKEPGTESGSQTGGDVPERNGQPGNAEYSQENSVPERNERTEGETIGEQITSAEAEGITLSDELDENGRKFVISGNGSTTFGEIRDGSGLTPAPIKLSEGFNRKDSKGKNHGYGLLHIEASHGDQIRNAGFKSINDFVEYVANGYTIIRNGNKRNSKETYLLELSDGKNNTLFIELSSDGNYWNVNSAGIFRRSYSRKKETVWSLPAVESTSTAEDEGVRNENISSNSMSGNSPQSVSSENKYTNLSQNDNVLEAKIAEEEKKVDLNPTDSQKEAGNYKKGHLKFDGLDFTIENVKGGIRSGKDRDGKEWSVKMNNTYGYIRGTEGVDGDHIDMFISEHPTHGNVYVIDQVNPDGTFDEHKVMYGFPNEDEAKAAYLANYSDGWKGLGNVTEVSREEFKKWIDSSKRKTKPFSEYKSVKPLDRNVSGQSDGIFPKDTNLLPKRLREAYESGDKASVVGAEQALIDYIDGSDDLKMIANTYFMSKDLLGKKDILSPSGRKMHNFISKACKDTLNRRGVPLEVFKSEKYRIDFAGKTDDSVALDIMSDDKSVEVVRAVINNPHTSDSTLENIAVRFSNNGLDWEVKQIINERKGKKDYQKEDDSIRFRLSDNDLTEEENRIINDSKQNGTFMKAPNGKDTNLTEKQWVQVRTKSFKDWFGDWEKAARIEKLRKSEPVRITGKEYIGKYELSRESAQDYILKNFRGEYKIKDTGENISLSKVGAKKVTSHSMSNDAHLKSIAAIPDLIKNSIFIEEKPNEKGNGKYERYRYYMSGLKIGDIDYTARLTIGVKNGKYYYDHYLTEIEKGNLIEIANGFKPTVDEPIPSYTKSKDKRFSSLLQINASKVADENGNKYYDHKLTHIEKGKLLDQINDQAVYDETINPEIQKSGNVSEYKDKRLSSLLQVNASKVVDENGEPKVVYHGTPLSRSQITPNRGWQSDGLTYVRQEAPFNTFKGGEYSGLIFTSVDEDKAMSIAEKRAMSIPDDENGNEQWTEEGYVYSLYLNSRNPFDAQNTAALDKVLSSFNDGNVPTLSFYGGKGDNVSVEEAKKIAESKNNSWILTETPEFISKVKSLGYDGLKGYDEGVQYIAVTKPLQIKSATENNGEFSPSDSDIRFRFIGEKGASRLDAEEEVTTRLDNLSVARDMERKGKSAKSVKLATGWERGSDGLWRYETLDIEYHPKGDARKGSILKNRPWYDEYMQLVNKILDGEPLTDEEQKRYDGFYEKEKEAREQYDNTEKIYLDDYVKDDELFKAYPELKQTRVVFEWKDGNESGSYSEKENVIRINGNSDIDAESTLVHEIQHSIQRIEGFSTGGNYKSVLNFFADHPEVEMNFVVNETYKEAQRKGIDVSKDELRRMFTESDDVAEGIENDVIERNGITESELGEIYNSGVDAGYRSISGEVEARNVQSRMGMTMNERLGSLAEETEDVAREDQIVLDRMVSHVMSMMEKKVNIEEVNKRFNEDIDGLTEENKDKVILSLGRPSFILRAAGIDDKPMKLYGNKVIKKMNKHGFKLEEIHDLPKAVADPIAVFNNYRKDGNRSVLTELEIGDKHILVSITLGKYGVDADFNIISSVFGKGGGNIVDWINKGYATYINKEKALQYLHFSKRNILEASNNAELSSAVKIVKDFENPKVSGVNLRYGDRLSNMVKETDNRKNDNMREQEEINRRFNEELDRFTIDNADNFVFSLGMPSNALLYGGIENKPIKLYGSKVAKKMRKHGFRSGDLKNLPFAVANPIAVFNNTKRPGNRSVLTELKTEKGNILVTLDLGKGMDADFDIVSSVFGKADNSIVHWINKGYATYINKEKALNYLHLSAPIAEASDNQELSSAVKIVKDFENPKVSGVNLRQIDRTASSSYEETDILDRYMNETRKSILHSPAPVIAESGKDIYAEMPDLSPIQLSRVIVAANNENVRAMYVPYTKQIVLLPKHGTAKEINDAYFHESVHFAVDMILPKGDEGRLTLERAGEEAKELDPRLAEWIDKNYNSNKSEEMVAHILENYFSYLDDKGKQDKLKAGVDFGSRYPVMNELSNKIINFLTTEKDGKIQSNGRRIERNASYDRTENKERSTETDTTALRGEQGEGEIKLAIKGKPRKKSGESEIEFYRRLREWEKQQEEIDKNSGTKAEPTTQYYTTLTEDLRRAQNRIDTQNIVINELEKLLKRHEEGKDVREAISSMVKKELSTGTISEFNKRELTSILSQMNKSVTGTKQEATEKAIMAIENIVNEAQARYVQRLIDRMLSLKIQDVNGKNMSIAKNVDDSTRKILSFIKGSASDLRTSGYEDEIRHLRSQNLSSRQDIEALERKIKLSDDDTEKEELQKEIDELNGIISANKEKLADLNNEIEDILKSKAEITDRDIETELDNLYEKMDRAAEGNAVWTISDNERMTSLLLLKQVRDYQKTDSQAVDIEDQIRQEFLNRTELYRKRAKEAYSENRQKLTEAIKNKTIRIRALTESMNALKKQKVDMMIDFSEELRNLISGGKDSLRRKIEEENERRGMLIVNTLKDITGDKNINIQDNKPRTENWFKKFIFSPLYSFEFLAKIINVNTLGEDGFFYNYFVKGENGVIESYNTYQRGLEYARNQLDNKCAELFGKNFDKVSANSDKVVGDSGVYITDYSRNEKYEKPLSKGQAMYIYMVWKMKDGRSKLELQGFTDDSIEDIKSFIGDNYIKLADWIQEELLPELREKYNQRYVEIFNTSLDKVENYVPLRIREEAVRQDVDLTDETKVKNTLEHKARSLIRRVVNVKPVDITMSAFDVIMGHLNEMEEWYAYARVRKDLESVLSNNRIRNQINTNMHGMFNNLKEAAAVATRSTTPKTGGFLDVALGKLSKGIIGGNIAFRVSTALKQVLSAPAFFGYSQSPLFINELVKSMSHPINTYKWALENLPSFRERLRQNNAGNEKLNDDDKLSKWMEKYIEVGMWPNKMIDAITCAIGAKSIYEYKLKRLKDSGIPREEAERKAKMDADIYYNGTQQSSHSAFLSPMQMSRSAVDRLMTTYQNSNIGYVRKVVSAYMDLKKSMDYNRILNEYKSKYIDEGMTPDEAEKKARVRIYNANKKYITGILLFGWGLNKLWEIGSLGLLGFIHSDDGDTREKNPLAKNITTYITSPLKGLPFTNVAENFIQGRDINPVFVFNELNDFKDEAKEIAEMYGVLSPELAYSILERGSTLSGVDLETWANVYTGVEDLVKNGATWDNALIDIMYVANFPRSNRLQVARELYKNADKEQYLERVSHAGNYIVPSAKLRTYIPGAIELSTTKAKDLDKQYELLNMTEEEREKYHALQTLTKVVLEDKELNKEWDENKDAETRREIAKKMYKNYSDENKNRSIETLIGASSIVYVGPVSDKEESRYLELSSYDDIMNDIRLKGYIADKKEFSDKYNQLLKDGKKDEAEQYYKDNSDNIRLYKAAFKYGQRINKLKKSLNKGNDNDVIDEIRRTRNSFFEEFK